MTDPTSGAIEAELRFLDPAVSSSPTLLGKLLHPDFTAFGSSGRIWNRDTLVAELRGRNPSRALIASDMKAVELAPGVVHVTFNANSNGRLTRRSSLWRLSGRDWLLYFHQGTVFSPGPDQDGERGVTGAAGRGKVRKARG
jgi:hypothetical protein